jgi:DNA-binding transcriptional ArsR family regulator
MSGSSAVEKARASATEKRLQAMSHPIRRLMLRVLRDRKTPTAPVELASEMGVDLKLLSYHVRELVKYGAIEKVASEPVRGALKHYYVATDQHLIDTGEWSAFDESQKEGALIDFMQPLVDDFSDAVKDGILGEDGQWHITRTPIHAVDSQGLEELLAAHMELYERVNAIHAASLERMVGSDATPIKVSSNQACFKVRTF